MRAAGANAMRGGNASRRGFTLLEVLLALALSILLMAGVFAFYSSTLQARAAAKSLTEDVKLYRSLLTSMASEVRQATAIVPGDGLGFQGERSKITIVKLGLPEKYAFDEYDSVKDKPPPAQLDLRRITYELLWDEERKDLVDPSMRLCHGLWRTEQKTFDPNPAFVVQTADAAEQANGENTEGDLANVQVTGPQPEGELYAPEIKFLEFAYFDGAQWRDQWVAGQGGETAGSGKSGATSGLGPMDSGSPLPQAVRITIGKAPVDPENEMFDLTKWNDLEAHPEQKEYRPDRFTIVVPLLGSDRTLMSSRKYGVADGMARQEGGATK